ncbi:hypothetical protein [Naasia lichenicola]|uniref:Uncharacterized protein n=1 Tax=Naasia lichenicola TaxID=2565933 RepID=A0A4S4FEE8_9MICO|nr:hypothetical protein [Naasia lichenicola]THG28398.1 hypothetical protein E6C64_16290 [Naasia lichenicola]
MSMPDEPELAGYQPGDGTPLRGRRMRRAAQVVVVLGVAGLVLPGVVTTVSVGTRTANALCANMVTYYVGEGTSSVARWEFFGPGVIGWECYSEGFGGEKHVASLGMIPTYREIHPARAA